MKPTCVNEWCGLRVERPGKECDVCRRSLANTNRIMGRVEAKIRERVRKAQEEELCK